MEDMSDIEFEILPKEATSEDFALLNKDDPIFAQMVAELAEIEKLKEDEKLATESKEEGSSYWSEGEEGESENESSDNSISMSEDKSRITGDKTPNTPI